MTSHPDDRRAAGATPAATAPSLTAATSPTGDSQVLDREQLDAILGDDPELLKDLVHLFLHDAASLLEAVRVAIEAGDASAVERSAHKLKGAVANFAALPATRAAQAIEQMGHGGDLAAAPPALGMLERELERLRPVLSALCG